LNNKDIISLRASILFIGIVVLGLSIVGKAAYEQQFRGKYWQALFAKFSIKKNVPIEALRGSIYADDNKVLAASLPQYDIVIDMSVAKKCVALAGSKLDKKVDTFFIEYAKLNNSKTNWRELKNEFIEASKYQNAADRFYTLEESIPFEKYMAIKEMPFASLGKYTNGFITKKRFERIKPLPNIASIIVGKVKEDAATRGLEYSFDSILKGVTGKQTLKFLGNDASTPIDEDGEVDLAPQNGSDIHTNINILMQEIAREELKKKLVENQSLYGCAIVMEVATGKIKAIANQGLINIGASTVFDTKIYGENEYDEYENYAMRKTEPGSTLKLITLMNLLEDKKVDINSVVDLEGGKWIYPNAKNGDYIEDAEQHGLHQVPVEVAFAASSNVGMSKLAYKFYSTNMQAYRNRLNALKLNRDSIDDIEIIKKENHINANTNSLPDFLRSSFGYVVQTSPIRMLSIYNAIANNGVLVKPYLVNAYSSEGITNKEFQPIVLNKDFCKKETYTSLQKCLLSVCYSQHGTANGKFKDLSFLVAGKTGTSYYLDRGISLGDRIYQSSFAGYFPANNPKYSCIVVIVNRKISPKHFGGDVAAPVFKAIASKVYNVFIQDSITKLSPTIANNNSTSYKGYGGDANYVFKKLGVSYNDNGTRFNDVVSTNFNNKNAIAFKQNIIKQTMPLLTGMNIKDAVYLCEKLGLRISVSGKGKVINQSVVEGSKIGLGQTVSIQLN